VLAEFRRGGPTGHVLLRYIQSLMTQMAQTAVCNRHHTVEQQLCRWLLLSLDRVPSNRIDMTQDLISNMLGVRRAGITQAASRLQAAGLIEYRRGHITVPDRAKLEAHACECYAVVKRETDRLRPPPATDALT
jgi:CRP-like cAMP-binding protein